MKHEKDLPTVFPSDCRVRRGFTLVELLVVITIIVALAAIAFYSVRNMKSKAYQANAMSSLRQTAALNVAYSTENNGDINTIRFVGDPKEGGGGAWVKNSFWGRIAPFLCPDAIVSNQNEFKNALNQRLDQLFSTTDADTMAGTFLAGAKIYHDGSGLPVPLGFNSNLNKWDEFQKTTRFGDPSRVLYASYGFGLFNDEDGQKYAPIPRNNTRPDNNLFYTDDRKAIVAFLDGHVELLSPPIASYKFQ